MTALSPGSVWPVHERWLWQTLQGVGKGVSKHNSDRQINKQRDRQTGSGTGRQTDRKRDREKHGRGHRADRRTGRQAEVIKMTTRQGAATVAATMRITNLHTQCALCHAHTAINPLCNGACCWELAVSIEGSSLRGQRREGTHAGYAYVMSNVTITASETAISN